MTFVDLHCHLLPGIDDGPASMRESLQLARDAVADGRRIVTCTPHVRSDFLTSTADLPERIRELRAALAADRIELEVRCGAELGICMIDRLDDDELDIVAHGPAGRRWLLVETPWEGIDEHLVDSLATLRQRGFGALLAHPERAPRVRSGSSMEILAEESRRGTLMQVTTRSLAREEVQAAAVEIVRNGWAQVLATDAHEPGPSVRLAPRASTVREIGFDRKQIEEMSSSTPGRLLSAGIERRPRRALTGRVGSFAG